MNKLEGSKVDGGALVQWCATILSDGDGTEAEEVRELFESINLLLIALGGIFRSLCGIAGRVLWIIIDWLGVGPISRPYGDGTVSKAYDSWDKDGILVHYWGDHIHLGYYELEHSIWSRLGVPFIGSGYKEAKIEMATRMLAFSGFPTKSKFGDMHLTADEQTSSSDFSQGSGGMGKGELTSGKRATDDGGMGSSQGGDGEMGYGMEKVVSSPPHSPRGAGGRLHILDLGCGYGGNSRVIARELEKRAQDCFIHGITISPLQQGKATALTAEAGLQDKMQFHTMDARKMYFAYNYFDMVWACETLEHIPDKEGLIKEMARVLKPGGTLVIAAWCQTKNRIEDFETPQRKKIEFVRDHWSHPEFESPENLKHKLEASNAFNDVVVEDWTSFTLPTWRHQLWEAIKNPIPVLTRPDLLRTIFWDAYCMHSMHYAFQAGLMKYTMIRAVRAQSD